MFVVCTSLEKKWIKKPKTNQKKKLVYKVNIHQNSVLEPKNVIGVVEWRVRNVV